MEKIIQTELKVELHAIAKGDRGYSAYELAIQDGYSGTLEEWLASLKADALEDAKENRQASEQARDSAEIFAQKAESQAGIAKQNAEESKITKEHIDDVYKALNFDIIGPGPEAMTQAALIVCAGPASMKGGE